MSRRGTRDERGAMAVWTAVALLGFMIVVGLGVDFTGHTRATQEARAVAAQAARAGGQAVEVTEGDASVVPVGAHQEAVRFAERAGYRASSRADGSTLRVDVAGSYETSFLGLIGIWSIDVRASATADVHSVRRR